MDIEEIEDLCSDIIAIESVESGAKGVSFKGKLQMEPARAFDTINQRLKGTGYTPMLQKEGEYARLSLIMLVEKKTVRPTINLILFIITIFTTILAGTLLAGKDPFHNIRNLIYGVPFSFTLLLILGSHELGHYFACKRIGIKATLPFFIPAPFALGTFGAVIKIKSPIVDRKGLIEVGAAGPLVGFIFTIPAIIVGLKLSKVVSPVQQQGMVSMGNSILFWFLAKVFTNPLPHGYDLLLHPVAFAGWVGMFVTSMNLLPIGQLDGGHICYSLFGRVHKFIAWAMVGILVILGIKWTGWFMWAFIVTLLGIKHPPPLNNISPLDTEHKMIGILSIVVFLITFIPCPFIF